jgi:hypothetical protein
MAFIVYDDTIGFTDLYLAQSGGFGPLSPNANVGTATAGRMTIPGMELRGYDSNGLGGGTFVFAVASAGITVGNWVMFTAPIASALTPLTATQWDGTIRSGRPLGVALTTLTTGQYGWFQVQGNAIASVNGTVAAGDFVYWQAAGVTSSTLVAGKQVSGAIAVTAASVTIGTGAASTVGSSVPGALTLSAAQAVVFLNRPAVQTNIT